MISRHDYGTVLPSLDLIAQRERHRATQTDTERETDKERDTHTEGERHLTPYVPSHLLIYSHSTEQGHLLL